MEGRSIFQHHFDGFTDASVNGSRLFSQWEHPKHVLVVLEIEETIDWWNGNFKIW